MSNREIETAVLVEKLQKSYMGERAKELETIEPSRSCVIF